MLFSLLLFFSLLGSSLSISITPLFCLQSSCNFGVSFNTTTLTLPDNCTAAISSESCSISVTFIYQTDTVQIEFDTTPADDTLRILSVLPVTEGYGTVMQYHCNSGFLCEWNYLNEVYHQYLRLNYTSLLAVLKPENDFDLPPLSEAADIVCIVNGRDLPCERGKCQAETFSNDSQKWEGSCLERSDFDQSIYKLQIVTRSNDPLSSYYDSFFVYQCYWDFCNTFEMVERIRAVIKTDYEVQLPSLGSTTTAPTVANSSVNNLTTTRMNNDCANVDIGYHLLLTLVLSSIMICLNISF